MVRFVQFVNSFVTSAGSSACGEDSMYNVVVGHVTDHPFLYHVHPHGISEHLGNLVFKLNAFLGFQKPTLDYSSGITECMHGHAIEIIESHPIKFFGFGSWDGADLRITKWVLMLWVALFVCALVFIPLARKIKKISYGIRFAMGEYVGGSYRFCS